MSSLLEVEDLRVSFGNQQAAQCGFIRLDFFDQHLRPELANCVHGARQGFLFHAFDVDLDEVDAR